MEETTINNNNMEEKLILNSVEDAEIISVRLSPDETPIAYKNRVRCLMLSGLSREEAEGSEASAHVRWIGWAGK